MKMTALALSLFTLATALSLQGPVMKVSLSLPLFQLIIFLHYGWPFNEQLL